MKNSIFITELLSEYEERQFPPHVLHILCLAGSITFKYHDTRYIVVGHDLVILTDPSQASMFTLSDDFKGMFMVLLESYTQSLAIRSNYGVIGSLTLMLNPVMKLDEDDYQHCREDIIHIGNRLKESPNDFWQEMIAHLLMAHIVFLYDVSARQNGLFDMNDRKAKLLVDFFSLLYKGEYITNRSLAFYADKLCITPHYLTDICRNATGHPASFWVDRFATNEIVRRLSDKDAMLSRISDDMAFSSLSHFSRYVQKRLGMSPTEYRKIKIIQLSEVVNE